MGSVHRESVQDRQSNPKGDITGRVEETGNTSGNQKTPKKTIILLFKGQHRREVLTVCHRSDAMLLKTLFKEAEDRKYKTITGVSKLMESKTVVV